MKHVHHIPIQTDVPLLPYEEIQQLILQSQKGCLESRERLIEANLKLVFSVVQRLKYGNELTQDLFQIGVIGLIKAIHYFDIDKGFRFSTYAVPTIIGEIKHYLRNNRSMKVSRTIQTNAKRIKNFCEEYLRIHETEPSITVIKEALQLSEEQFYLAIGSTRDILSMSEIASKNEEQSRTWEDNISEKEDWMLQWVEEEYVKQLMCELTDKEKEVIKQRYYFDKTQSEVGKLLSVSQVQVSRIEKSALLKLRKIVQ